MPRSPLLLLLLLLVLGCGATPPRPLGPPPARPLGPALAVVPVERGYRPTRPRREVRAGTSLGPSRAVACAACGEPAPIAEEAYPPCAECGHDVFVERFSPPFAPAVDAPRVQARVIELLEERSSFAGVRPAPAFFAQAEDRRRSAEEAGAAWVLELEVDDARVELVEHNGLYPVKVALLIVQSVLIFPAVDPIDWFIPSEVYGYEARVRWRLREVGTGEVLDEGRLTSLTSDAFGAFNPGPSRSWFLVGFLRVPGCLDLDDWAEISAQLEERAHEELARAVVEAVEEAARTRTRTR